MRPDVPMFLRALWALLTRSPHTFTLGSRQFHLFPDGTVLPAIGGGDGSDDPDPEPDPEPKDDPEPDPDPEPKKDEPLGEKGKAALASERKARRDAEKRAKDAEEKAKQYEEAKLSDQEKAEKRAEEAEAKVAKASAKAQRANLLNALAEKDLTGPRAKAAARLLDTVEFDEEDEPTNLDDAIEAATAEYGEDSFKGATPAAPGGADQGARDGANKQLSSTEGMTPEEIAKAASEGRLDDYLKKSN